MLYSFNLRKQPVSVVHSKMKKTKIFKRFNIYKQMLYNGLGLEKTQGYLEGKTEFQNGHSHGIKDLKMFKDCVELHPDKTQEEMVWHYSIDSSMIGRCLKKRGYFRIKNDFYPYV